MLRALKTATFFYVPQEDRIAGAINAGHPDAWSCWLTRRLALAVLERAADYIANTSNLAQRAPAELRGEAIAFEREAAIAKTAPAMSQTSPAILQSSTAAAELADRLTISREQDAFRLELRGHGGNGVAGVVKREELQPADAARRRHASRLACRARRRAAGCRGSAGSKDRAALEVAFSRLCGCLRSARM
jgi:hypothetical protein